MASLGGSNSPAIPRSPAVVSTEPHPPGCFRQYFLKYCGQNKRQYSRCSTRHAHPQDLPRIQEESPCRICCHWRPLSLPQHVCWGWGAGARGTLTSPGFSRQGRGWGWTSGLSLSHFTALPTKGSQGATLCPCQSSVQNWVSKTPVPFGASMGVCASEG